MQTVTRKDYYGSWTSKSQMDLPDNWVLQIHTSKVSNGTLVTTATVHKVEGNSMTHRMFTDYSKRIAVEKIRCTEKNVIAQHTAALALLDQVLSEVNAKYNFGQTAETA
jgi:hypothetical protein